MEGLKQKALNGAKWSLLQRVINIGFEFAVGIMLARLLMPTDFGTVAIINVVISFSSIFVNSGFSQSLARDLEVDNKDFSAIFIFNLFVGIVFYGLIFFLSSSIASFYQNNDLTLYVKILGLSIFISSLTLVQRVNLTRAMNFKLMSKISIVSSLSSGVLALGLAFNGFGIWSLIIKTLLRELMETTLLWLNNKWKPSLVLNTGILKRHFRYGSNFLASAIIGQVYNTILALSIGKIYNLQTLGFYGRAQLFSNTISENIGGVMTGVSFPALAKIQDDKEKYLHGVRLLLKQALYIVGILMVMIFFSSKTIIPFLLGEKWAEAGVYLQYLCVIGVFGVLNSILVNSISVTGRSDIYLYFQIWGLVLNIISLALGFFYGINVMLYSLIVVIILSYILISAIFNSLFQFSIFDQIKDFRSILIVLLIIIAINLTFIILIENSMAAVILSLFFQVISIVFISSALKIEEFLLICNLFNHEKNYK